MSKISLFERDVSLDSRLQGCRIKIIAEMKEKLRGIMLDDTWSEFEATCAHFLFFYTVSVACSFTCHVRGKLPLRQPSENVLKGQNLQWPSGEMSNYNKK